MRRTGTFILGGLAVAAAGSAAYLITRKVAGESLPPPRAFSCPPGEHVGTVGYVWPHPELFLDESGFGEALETFGYEVDDWDAPEWTACSESVVGLVRSFQRDYNSVYAEGLPTDGLIRDATIEAMVHVHELQLAGETWPLIVLESKGTPA